MTKHCPVAERHFHHLPNGAIDQAVAANLMLACERLGVRPGARADGATLLTKIERLFGFVPTRKVQKQVFLWLNLQRQSLVEIHQLRDQSPMTEVTLKEIAADQGIHYIYAHRLSREPGFPNPVRVIGRNLMFDADAVSRYFAKRKRRAPRSRQ